MTRVVLSDCRLALAGLHENPTGQQWRIQWVGTLALLRTVANTFNEQAKDPTVHPNLHQELNDFWDRMKVTEPQPEIYWGFIRIDANDLLHYWKFSAAQHSTTQRDELTRTRAQVSAKESSVHAVDFSGRFEGFEIEDTYLMKSGPFAGQDSRDVVRQAIEWYEQEIADMIERAKP